MQVTEFTNKQNHTHRQPKTIHYLLSLRRDKIIIIIIINDNVYGAVIMAEPL